MTRYILDSTPLKIPRMKILEDVIYAVWRLPQTHLIEICSFNLSFDVLLFV